MFPRYIGVHRTSLVVVRRRTPSHGIHIFRPQRARTVRCWRRRRRRCLQDANRRHVSSSTSPGRSRGTGTARPAWKRNARVFRPEEPHSTHQLRPRAWPCRQAIAQVDLGSRRCQRPLLRCKPRFYGDAFENASIRDTRSANEAEGLVLRQKEQKVRRRRGTLQVPSTPAVGVRRERCVSRHKQRVSIRTSLFSCSCLIPSFGVAARSSCRLHATWRASTSSASSSVSSSVSAPSSALSTMLSTSFILASSLSIWNWILLMDSSHVPANWLNSCVA
mmetsp:Transcript_4115/g.25941  ORF Transcript_4115/g.25941 Transcript_4115/m.25941 type:complete len:276 (+) Transcript_4115:1151-1978(+)